MMKVHHGMACLLLALGSALTLGDAAAAVLGPGQTLQKGQRLYSASNLYYATLDPNGDFVVYRSSDGARTWSTRTPGSGAVAATMQRDGRFVLTNALGTPIWSTPTRGRHRVFGLTAWGTAVVINARKWKPRDKRAEPIVEQMLTRRAKLDWQSPAADSPAIRRRQAQAREAALRSNTKRPVPPVKDRPER